MKKKQSGFTFLAVVLVIIILGLVGIASWRVWDKNRSHTNSAKTATTNKNSSDLYGEVDGNGYYRPSDGKFKMQLPDGWVFHLDGANNRNRIAASCSGETDNTDHCQTAQKKPAVLKLETSDNIYPNGLDIWYIPKDSADYKVVSGSLAMGTKTGEIKAKNLTGQAYYYENTNSTKEPVGRKVYTYLFTISDGSIISIYYDVLPNYTIDHIPEIKKMISTLEEL